GLTVADHTHDIRGRKVVDRSGEEIGDVDELFVDEGEQRVRFIRVASGGFLGLVETKFLMPVDAITYIDDDIVHVDQTREHVAGAPPYDPELVEEPSWLDYYAYYGYDPYWDPAYMYPPYPIYP